MFFPSLARIHEEYHHAKIFKKYLHVRTQEEQQMVEQDTRIMVAFQECCHYDDILGYKLQKEAETNK